MKNFWGYFVGGIFVAGLGAFFFAPQPELAGHTMTSTDTSALAESDPIVSVALPDSLSDNARIGKVGFEAKCSACHGVDASGKNGVAPPLVHKIYEPSHHADEAFWIATQNGVRSHHWNFGNMPAIDGLTRGDVKMIVAYVRELQRENGIN